MISKEMKSKAKFFFDKVVEVHINCGEGRFYNGLIIEFHEDQFVLIDDRVLGETPIYFSEIVGVERCRNRGKEDGKICR